MVKDIAGAVSFEVVPSRSVDERAKELLASYKKACLDYKAASRKGVEAEKPVKPALKVLGSKVRGKDKADALMAKYQKLYEQKKAKEAQKESKQAAPPA